MVFVQWWSNHSLSSSQHTNFKLIGPTTSIKTLNYHNSTWIIISFCPTGFCQIDNLLKKLQLQYLLLLLLLLLLIINYEINCMINVDNGFLQKEKFAKRISSSSLTKQLIVWLMWIMDTYKKRNSQKGF